jgi:choline dehydrogenase-like flavoprotein
MIDTSNKEIQSQDDYIVVGAGAAGSVLAGELSASGAQVLIIESGGPDDAPTILNPSVWFYNIGGPLDYRLPVTPSPLLNNRKFNMAARWVKVRVGNVVSIGSKRGKRTISAAGRKGIAAAQRARWAKVRAAKKAA